SKQCGVDVKLARDNLFVFQFSNSDARDWVLDLLMLKILGTMVSIGVEVPKMPPKCNSCHLFRHSDKTSHHSKEKLWRPN
ncbi:hypothetical protein Gotri_024258, partial [Gossypium trilobum]|nr:hypothetical protein [Gossypium trilobum]